PDTSRRSDDADLMPKQVDDECRQSIVLTLGPAIFDGDVLPFDVSALLQSLMECCECIGGLAGGPTAEKADHRHGRLLPPRALHFHREQQTAAADQGNELTPRRVEHGLLPEPAVPAYRRLRMPRKRPQVLGVDLNRSESSRQPPACR